MLELIPVGARSEITAGAAHPDHRHRCGVDCSGQVLVLHDMLGHHAGKLPRFEEFHVAMTASSMRSAVTLLK